MLYLFRNNIFLNVKFFTYNIFSWKYYHFTMFAYVTENTKKPFSSVYFTVKWNVFPNLTSQKNPGNHHQIGKTQTNKNPQTQP